MKKYLKKMFAGILLVIFTLSFAVAAYAAAPETGEDYDEVIAIIHTNDVHGHIEVEPYVKGLADEMKASGEYSLVLTVSAGDVYTGGHAVAGYYNGELIPAIEDQVYDVIVPGNNDFPAGIPSNVLLSALYTHTKTICANIQVKEDTDMAAYAASYSPKIGNEDFAAMYEGVELNTEDGLLDFSNLNLGTIAAGASPWQETLIIETSKGTKLGLFGLTCTYIGQTQGTVNAAMECVADLKEEGANVIVGIGHTGWMGEGSTAPSQVNDTNSWVVASEVQDMDALIDSHTHSIINDGNGCYVGENQVLVNQASCFGKCIGIMYIYLKDGEVVDKKAELLYDDEVSAITPDPAVQATVDAAFERLYAIAGEPVATAPYFLNGGTSLENEGGHVRGNETNMGDFVTDILRAAASEKAGIDFAFSFIPGYCVRSSVEESADITNIEIASIFGMPLRLGPKVYSAKEIVDLVSEALTAVYPSFGAKFMQFSGISVEYIASFGADGKTTTGTPVQIKVGDTVIYDIRKGGIQVGDSWTIDGLRTLHPNDNVWEGDEDELIAKDMLEVRELFHDYLAAHEEGTDYEFYPNMIAPADRIVEVTEACLFPGTADDYTGVAQKYDGDWYYLKDGYVQDNYTGVQNNAYGWWYVENGKVDFTYTGFAENQYGWWYVEKGQVKFNKNDILPGTVDGEEGWYLVKESKLSDETTIAQNAYGWWKIEDGKVNFDYTGLAENQYGWWYLKDGKVDFNYTGFAENQYGWWYVEKGQITFKKNDILSGKGKDGWWLIEKSKVSDKTTVAQNAYGWWFVDEGEVNFNYNGAQPNDYGIWYIKNGKVDFTFNGPAYGYIFKEGKAISKAAE